MPACVIFWVHDSPKKKGGVLCSLQYYTGPMSSFGHTGVANKLEYAIIILCQSHVKF
jgi:hypothetical protein